MSTRRKESPRKLVPHRGQPSCRFPLPGRRNASRIRDFSGSKRNILQNRCHGLCRLLVLVRQFLHFSRNHGKPLSSLSCSRCFNGSVKRKQLGLGCDFPHQSTMFPISINRSCKLSIRPDDSITACWTASI